MTTSSSGGQSAGAASGAEENARQLGRRIEYDGDHLSNLLADGQHQDTVPVIVRIYNNVVALQLIIDGIIGPGSGNERWRAMNMSQETSTNWEYLIGGVFLGAFIAWLLMR